jgi:uncharacterized protein (TIGR02217 family)
MSFDEIRFPTAISLGATGGPERRTEIVTLASGAEERNSRWANSRRRWNAGFGIKSLADIRAVVAFFEERRGRLHGFRWKDHADFAGFDQLIGTGTSALATFQLVKRYGSGLRDYMRMIAKPVAGTVSVKVNGVSATQFTVNAASGIVTFNPGFLPLNGQSVTASFEFDCPARFDTDMLSVNLKHFGAGDIPDIPIVEVRP